MHESNCPKGKEDLRDAPSPAKKRKHFLQQLIQTLSWDDWLSVLRHASPDYRIKDGQLEYLLRVHVLSKVYHMDDPELPEALNDSLSFRKFLGIKKKEKAVLDMAALALLRDRLMAVGLHERINHELAPLMLLADTGHSGLNGTTHADNVHPSRLTAHGQPAAIKQIPEAYLPMSYVDGSKDRQAADCDSQALSYLSEGAMESERDKALMRKPSDHNVKMSGGHKKGLIPAGHSVPLPPVGSIARKRRKRQKGQSIWPAALMMIAFLVGCYFFGLVLYQRAR